MIIRTECRNYKLDRPCTPHKKTGTKCQGCEFYDPVKSRILLIKLGAMGDVLRTTALLKSIKAMMPGSHLTWLVLPRSRKVLEGLNDIDRIWGLDTQTLSLLHVEEFEWVINLDLSAGCLSLASLAKGRKKSGYGLRTDGAVQCWNEEAEYYLSMSYWDDIKKKNTKTYQRLMLDIIGCSDEPDDIQVSVPPDEVEYAMEFFEQARLDLKRPVIGLNLGAAGRWRWKRWTAEGFLELGRRLWEEKQANLLILSGPDERELKDEWIRKCDFPVIDAGSNNDYHRFAAFIGLCDVVVSGDTMTLHLALALKRSVVALFGPTSIPEVELYGRGVALAGDVPCLCCYLSDCTVSPSCMESLKGQEVFEAVINLLEDAEC